MKFFTNWWPFIVGFILMAFFALKMKAQDKPTCGVSVQEQTYIDVQGKTEQQSLVIIAGTASQQLAHYETVLGPKGAVKWKDLWKLRRKAEQTCEEYLEYTEKQTRTLPTGRGDLKSAKR